MTGVRRNSSWGSRQSNDSWRALRWARLPEGAVLIVACALHAARAPAAAERPATGDAELDSGSEARKGYVATCLLSRAELPRGARPPAPDLPTAGNAAAVIRSQAHGRERWCRLTSCSCDGSKAGRAKLTRCRGAPAMGHPARLEQAVVIVAGYYPRGGRAAERRAELAFFIRAPTRGLPGARERTRVGTTGRHVDHLLQLLENPWGYRRDSRRARDLPRHVGAPAHHLPVAHGAGVITPEAHARHPSQTGHEGRVQAAGELAAQLATATITPAIHATARRQRTGEAIG